MTIILILLYHLQPVERDNPVLPLEVQFEKTSIGKLRFILKVESSFDTMPELGFSEYDTDDVKGILFDTSLFLLLVTVFVSCFHVRLTAKKIQAHKIESLSHLSLTLSLSFFLISWPLKMMYNSGDIATQWLGYHSVVYFGVVSLK